MQRTNRRPLFAVIALAVGLLTVAACDSREDRFDGDGDADSHCRNNPGDCEGDIGGDCRVTDDCADGVCCTDDKNCGGGMCLYRCSDDVDCPSNQRCEHDHCFFSCSDDRDCGPGQSCEHGNTICEYP